MFEVMTKNPVYVTLHGNRLEGFKIDEANWISMDGFESELEESDSESVDLTIWVDRAALSILTGNCSRTREPSLQHGIKFHRRP